MMTQKKVAMVTGACRGIGLGIAKCLVEAGYDLVANGRKAEAEVADVLGELRGPETDVLYCQADVTDADGLARMVDAAKDHFGQMNLLVNNAGVAPSVRLDILETTRESYDRVMDINLRGPFFLTQAIANWMIEKKQADESFDAAIINISSVSATFISPNRAEYCLSKAGISMATQLWAVRMADYGIPVYEVRPGLVKTDMTKGVTGKYDKLIAEGLCVQPRWGTSEEVGGAVVTLARGDLPYSTGQVLMLDGGMSIPRL